MKRTQIFFSIILMLAVIFNPSCKKDPAPTPTGNIIFHMHTAIDSTEVEAGAVAADANGRHFQLDVAQLLISGITLKKSDGTYQTLDNVYFLKNIEEEIYAVGSAPAGNYVAVSFNVGVDAAANANAPSSFTSPNPLADVTNWFGTTAQGFIFANLQGKADVSAGQTGPVDQAFSYQLGTSNMLKTVTMSSLPFTVVANSDNVLHIIADYGVMLQGVDFKTHSTSTPWSNAAVAQQIANNIPNMFHYEE